MSIIVRSSRSSSVAALVGSFALAWVGACGGAQSTSTTGEGPNLLVTDGTTANFGSLTLAGGFSPDPHEVSVVSGGQLAVHEQGIVPANSGLCRGHVTPQPDLIFQYESPRDFLRFYVRASGDHHDTTLVVRAPDGRWYCADDEGGNLHPLLDLTAPAAGRYELWVGSYSAEDQVGAVLYVTELESQRP